MSICGVTTTFQGSRSAPLICRCVVMIVILSPSKCSLSPQCPTSHLSEETAPTSQEAIYGFLFLGALLFGATVAACRCQGMARQGLGHHTQLLDVRVRFHQEVLHFIGSFFLEPKQVLQDINEGRRIAAHTEQAKVFIIASAAIVSQLDGILFLLHQSFLALHKATRPIEFNAHTACQ